MSTWDYEPSDEQVKSDFGPGDYTVLMAKEGIVGLSKVRDITIPWEIEYVEWVGGTPTTEYVRDKHGDGNYFILTSCKIAPQQIFPIGQPHDVTWQHLQDGANVMKRISIIFRVKMPWI